MEQLRVRLERDGDVAVIVIDNPPINAGSAAVREGLMAAIATVKADQTVEMRQVTVARTRGAETVIAGGVQPGETVVTDGHLRLVPGSRVGLKAAGVEQVAQ